MGSYLLRKSRLSKMVNPFQSTCRMEQEKTVTLLTSFEKSKGHIM